MLLTAVLLSMLSHSYGESLPCREKSSVTLPGLLNSLLPMGEHPEGQHVLQEHRLSVVLYS